LKVEGLIIASVSSGIIIIQSKLTII
jgi:hypothetical protein